MRNHKYFFELCIAQHGNTTLIRAAWKGHVEVVKYLVEMACVSVDAQNQIGNNALIIACEKGDLAIVQFLVEEAGALLDLENDVSLHVDMRSNT